MTKRVAKKPIKIISALIVVFLFSVGIVKCSYRDSSEKRGFDFDAPFEFSKDYVLLRLFVPATTTGINDEIRKQRTTLLNDLNTQLLSANPDVDSIRTLQDKLIENDKEREASNYFVERQGKQAYYKTVTSPKIEEPIVLEDAFTVAPYFIYSDNESLIMRWVIDPKFSTDIYFFDSEGRELRFSAIQSKTPYNEILIKGLVAGSWNWNAHATSENIEKTVSGELEIRTPTTIAFYADTQDSLDLHRKAAEFVKKLHAEKPLDIILHGGDITSFGSNENEMILSAAIFSSIGIPGIFIKGNHEFTEEYGYTRDAPYYQKLFSGSLQGQDDFRTYTLGDKTKIRLMVWDTNFVRMPSSSFLLQDRLLRKTLNESGDLPVILAGHHGYFTKGWHGSFLGSHSEIWIDSLYLDLFQSSDLLLTLSAHDHVFQRIIDEKSKTKTQHIVAGTISAKILFPYFQSPGEVKAVERKRTVTVLDLTPHAVAVKTYDVENETICDEAQIEF